MTFGPGVVEPLYNFQDAKMHVVVELQDLCLEGVWLLVVVLDRR